MNDELLQRMDREIEDLTAENERLREALRPFSKAHQSLEPYSCITLHDLRMAFQAMQFADDDSTPALQDKDK